MRRALILSLTVASSIVAIAPPARADDYNVYRLSPELDIPIAGSILGFTLASFFATPSTQGCGACDPMTVNALDRIATGRDSGTSRSASDIALYLSMATPLLIEAATLDDPMARSGALFTDTVVYAETLALTFGVTQLLKNSVARARPGAYRQAEMELDSFPSGHTSVAFASAAAGCSLYVRRAQPTFGEGALACSPGFALAAATAALRVDGGRHFPTDVLAGAAIGTAIGLFIPWLHGTF